MPTSVDGTVGWSDVNKKVRHGEHRVPQGRLFTLRCHHRRVGFGWTVASERVTRLALPAHYRYGQMLPGTRRPKTVPERYGHAVEPDAAATLCGRPLLGLYRFDSMYFETLGHHLRCRACDEAAGHPHVTRRR